LNKGGIDEALMNSYVLGAQLYNSFLINI